MWVSGLLSGLLDVCSKYPAVAVKRIHNGTVDIAIIITGINGLTIGIESQGDPGSRLRLQDTLTAFVSAKCDIIFCACRTRGMTVDWVRALSPQYRVNFEQQTWVLNNYAAANAATATRLMRAAGI